MKRFGLIGIPILLSVIALIPWVLYEIGLDNIDGRPTVVEGQKLSETEAVEIWQDLNEKGPIRIEKMNPYGYLFCFLSDDELGSGAQLTWYVARNYNANHLNNKRLIYWHLSGAALVIWLSRNWSAEQLLTKAKDIQQTK